MCTYKMFISIKSDSLYLHWSGSKEGQNDGEAEEEEEEWQRCDMGGKSERGGNAGRGRGISDGKSVREENGRDVTKRQRMMEK